MLRAPRLVLLAGLLLLTATCERKTTDPPVSAPPGSSIIRPTRGIHLRMAFDDDPTTYVGRFVPDATAVEEIDESAAVQSRCSELFGHKVVNGGQELDEIVYSSRAAGGSLGVKPIAGLKASTASDATMRIHYKLTKRLQVFVKDPAALARCCEAAPRECSGRVVGDFLMGTGEVYQAYGAKDVIEASGMAKTVTGDLEYKDDIGWKRVNAFKDVYFAFLTTERRTESAAAPAPDDCSWCDSIPTSLDGAYFCGVSAPAPSEGMARDLAMRNAREQTVKYLGEYLTSESATQASLVKGYLEDVSITTAMASGVASRVKDTKWCKPSTTSTPEGARFTSKVLAFFPNAEKTAVAKATVEAMIAKKPADKAKLHEVLDHLQRK